MSTMQKPIFIKPIVGGSVNTWGNELNLIIDQQDEFNQQLLDGKQDSLESGITIKTINGIPILGEGDIGGIATEEFVNTAIDEIEETLSQSSSSYEHSFTSSDLVDNHITIIHNLKNKYVIVSIYDESDKKIYEDETIPIDDNTVKIDLTSFASTMVGTYNAKIVGGGNVIDGNVLKIQQNVFRGTREQYDADPNKDDYYLSLIVEG